jgi:hypothetical protein
MKSRETRHLPKGGTAFGLRLLYEYIKTKRWFPIFCFDFYSLLL